MSDFHELIKSFPKTRDYVRDFFVYGFKTRNDFKEKSPRTYDNERRRLESWLAPYVRKDYAPGGSSISLAIDSSLLALNPGKNGRMKLELLSLSRIQSVRPVEKILSSCMDLNALIRNSYYNEPVTLHIVNRRNALERAMLHFANYEKNTTKIDEDAYECLIYYNQSMETELLIEVLSFGPMLTVIGNKRFLCSLKARLRRQRSLLSSQKNGCV